jgi:hypothetical protein
MGPLAPAGRRQPGDLPWVAGVDAAGLHARFDLRPDLGERRRGADRRADGVVVTIHPAAGLVY